MALAIALAMVRAVALVEFMDFAIALTIALATVALAIDSAMVWAMTLAMFFVIALAMVRTMALALLVK